MKDQFGRTIEYLRISVTQKCSLNCIYCNPDSASAKKEDCESLTPEDFHTVVRIMADLGIRKVRLTGGEPLLRKDICEIISAISSIDQIVDLSLTTNGQNLEKMAVSLKKAGLKRINISLDSLDAGNYAFITGGGSLEKVMRGIDAAIAAGLNPVKINVVPVKGVNDREIDGLIRLAIEKPVEVRFIELMPVGAFGENNRDKIVYHSEIIRDHPELIKADPAAGTSGPAELYTIEGAKGRIGLISPMSHRFCGSCNRIRLTCDGKLKPCLGDNREVDILKMLRENPADLPERIRETIFNKPRGHHFNEGFSSSRNMNHIGG